MAKYSSNHFDRLQEITDYMPQKSDMTQKMQNAMSAVDLQGDANEGRWFISKCKSTNGRDDDKAVGEFYPVYFPVKDGDLVDKPKLVAAPCPPFCQDETPGDLEERLYRIEKLITELTSNINAFITK